MIVLAIGFLALIPLYYYVTGIRRHQQTGNYQSRIIRRRTLELLLRHVEAILVDQSVMGIILNYGSVTLTGQAARETFGNISNPLEFRRRVQGEAAKDVPTRDALPQQPRL